jgi:superfamily I DNA/RNA helicase
MMNKVDWKPAGGLTLEPNALLAINHHDKSVAVTAGPGAGKTEMLAQKADFLLRTGSCYYPQRILAIAFKVDASANLRNRVRQRCPQDYAERFDSFTFHAFAKRIIDRFRPVLKGQDALDPDYTIGEVRVSRTQITFQDLVPLAVEILKSSQMVRTAIAQTYSHVFLDEFQDCTKEQYQLVKLAFHGTETRLTAVGDTKQRIMGFAGALEGIFVSFAEDFKAVPLNLYLNFRSLPRLRRMQNEMVKKMDANAAVPDDQLQGNEGEIVVRQYASDDLEAQKIADMIQHWIEVEGLPPSEIAVLVSVLPECFTYKLADKLLERKIPFRNEKQMQDMAKEPIVELTIAFFRCVFFDRNPQSYEIVSNFFERYRSQEFDERHDGSFTELIENYRVQVSKKTFAGASDPFLRRMSAAFRKVTGEVALRSLLPNYVQGSRLDELFEELHVRLAGFLTAGLLIEEALGRFGEDNAVRIMTVHKSKGLEFHTVVGMGIENESFFNSDDVERPVFFVMISRAKERLFLSCCKQRPRPPFYKKRWDEARTAHKEFLTYGLDAAKS